MSNKYERYEREARRFGEDAGTSISPEYDYKVPRKITTEIRRPKPIEDDGYPSSEQIARWVREDELAYKREWRD